MQIASSRIWTLVTGSISCDDDRYAKHANIFLLEKRLTLVLNNQQDLKYHKTNQPLSILYSSPSSYLFFSPILLSSFTNPCLCSTSFHLLSVHTAV